MNHNRLSYAFRHNDTKNINPPSPYYLRHFQVFNKIDSFPKKKNQCFYLNYKIRWNTTTQTYKMHLIIHQLRNSWPFITWLFWAERDFCIISDCRDLFNNFWASKKKINLTNTQSSSEESLKEKRHTVIGMCSLFIGSIYKYWTYVIDDIAVLTTLSNI